MKSCELCKLPARMYCESDEASLCWACDAKVHGANFLVARHTRSLLCNSCQSLTPWKASGPKLGPTVSVCERCADGREEEESDGGNDDEIDGEDDIDESDDAEEDDEVEVCVDDDDDEDGDGDNQVVPWSSTPPPPAASPSSSEDSDGDVSESETVFSLKRKRENVSDRRLQQEDLGCSSSRQSYGSASAAMAAVTSGDGEATCVDSSSSMPLKGRKTEPDRSGPKSAAIIESLKRFYHHDIRSGNNASDSSKETRAVD